MNSVDKYTQFKNKYNKYKYKNNKLNQFGGRKVTTKSNSGSLEKMSNQCFWISILDYLHANGHPELTLRELRKFVKDVGIKINKENEIFDSNLYRHASEYIADIFDLTIRVYLIDHRGNILHRGDTINIIGNGRNVFDIAQFGQYHFELITNSAGLYANNFRPLVVVKNNLTDINDIPMDMRQQYILITEDQGELGIMENLLKEDELDLEEKQKQKKEIEESYSFDDNEKIQFIENIDSFLTEGLIPNIEAKIKRIEDLKNEIASIQSIIELYERGEIP